METVMLGQSGLKVSALCLGTMTWGTQNSEAEGHGQMDQALAAGVNFLDTAEMYPVNPIRVETIGLTETIIGNWIARTSRRGDWIIATKIAGEGSQARGGEAITGAAIGRALEASLRRLRTDWVDIYQLHWPNRDVYHFRDNWIFDPRSHDPAAILANMERCLEALSGAIASGKIRQWGLSNETVWGMAQWLRLADRMGVARPITIQNEYSLLCRLWDTDMAELAHNEDLTLLGFSPLATGLLSGKYQGDVVPAGSRRSLNPTLGGRIGPRVWPAVDAYLAIAKAARLDPAQMAIAWAMSRPVPTVPIIGATTREQLANVLAAADVRLSPEVSAAIAAAHRAHPLPY